MKTSKDIFWVLVVIICLAILLPSQSHTTISTPGSGGALRPLVRIDQTARGQYSDGGSYKQWKDSTCSTAAIAEVANVYSEKVSRIADILPIELQAHAISSQLGLLDDGGIGRTVNLLGLQAASGYQLSLDQIIHIANIGVPVIVGFPDARAHAYYPGGHLLVVTGGNDQTIYVADSSAWNRTSFPRAFFMQLWGGFSSVVTPKTSFAHQPGNSDPYNLLGKPHIGIAQLNAILAAYGSPLAGQGQFIYEEGQKFGINSDVAMGFWLHDSTLMTQGEATKTLNPGNIRCGIPEHTCVDMYLGGYSQMNSPDDGVTQWYQLIESGYVKGGVDVVNSDGGNCTPLHPCTTLDEVLKVYAPSADHNNVAAYVNAVKGAEEQWWTGALLIQ
jgi:hypothetical protein